MAAPHTSLTIPLPISDMTGLLAERLYVNIRTTAMTSMLATEDILFSVGSDGLTSLMTLVDCIAYAVATEVVAEITSHSRLTEFPGARDQGPAGAGIIAGFVR